MHNFHCNINYYLIYIIRIAKFTKQKHVSKGYSGIDISQQYVFMISPSLIAFPVFTELII